MDGTAYKIARIGRRIRRAFGTLWGRDVSMLRPSRVEKEKARLELRALRTQRHNALLLRLPILILLVLLVVTAWRAVTGARIVIDPFEVPSALEQKGFTGRMIAHQVMDELIRFRSARNPCRGPLRPMTYTGAWDEPVEVRIPAVGLSLSDAERLMRGWLRTERHFGGSILIPSEGTVAMIARGSGEPGATGIRSHQDIPSIRDLSRRAAWVLIRREDPLRLGIHLLSTGHRSEGRAVIGELRDNLNPEQRKWGFWAHGVLMWQGDDFAQAARDFDAALRLDPKMADVSYAYGQLAEFAGAPGDALRSFRAAAANTRPGPCAPISATRDAIETEVAFLTQDGARLPELLGRLAASSSEEARGNAAEWLPDQAAVRHENFAVGDKSSFFGSQSALAIAVGLRSSAVEAGARAVLRSAHSEVLKAQRHQGELSVRRLRTYLARGVNPEAAEAFALAGRIAEARAVIAHTDPGCYPCMLARGAVARAAKDYRSSESALLKAIEAAPSIPDGYKDLGDLFLEQSRPRDAISEYRLAAAAGPGWADPLKAWGDALLALGDAKGALEKFEQADKRAPRWGELHVEWAKALWHAGRQREAIAMLNTAAAMDLGELEQARIRRLRLAMRRLHKPG